MYASILLKLKLVAFVFPAIIPIILLAKSKGPLAIVCVPLQTDKICTNIYIAIATVANISFNCLQHCYKFCHIDYLLYSYRFCTLNSMGAQ